MTFDLAYRRQLAISLAAALAYIAPASAATRAPYQKEVQLQCSGGSCTGSFPKLQNNQRLELSQVICRSGLQSSESMYEAVLSYGPVVTPFYYYLVLESKINSGGNTFIYVFGQDGLFLVSAGEQLFARLSYSGGTPGSTFCSIHGEVVRRD